MTTRNPFRYFKTSPEIIRIAVTMYVRFSLSLRNVEDRLRERGIDGIVRGNGCDRVIVALLLRFVALGKAFAFTDQ